MTSDVKKAILSQDMTKRINPLARVNPTKRSRDAAELAELADRFKADWRQGDRVMTWLKRHEGRHGELSQLVEDGWSWADVGQAMFQAGVSYSTGKPIDGSTLRVKASQARRVKPEKQTEPVAVPSSPVPVSGNGSAVAAFTRTAPSSFQRPDPSPPAWSEEATLPEEPMFRPVSLRGGRKLPPPQDPPQMKTSPVVVKATDDEIIERILGRKP